MRGPRDEDDQRRGVDAPLAIALDQQIERTAASARCRGARRGSATAASCRTRAPSAPLRTASAARLRRSARPTSPAATSGRGTGRSIGWSAARTSLPLSHRDRRQYPSFTMPSFAPLTVPFSSHSSDARNRMVRLRLPHRVVRRAAEIDQHLLRRAEIGVELAHALRRHLLVVNAGDHQRRRHASCRPRPGSSPTMVVCGARRTPGPQVAPTGSEASISDQTTSLHRRIVPASAQPIWRSQLASNSARDWVLNGTPAAGSFAGGPARRRAVVGGASSTSRFTFSRMLRGVAAGARTAERPGHQADALDAPQRADVVDGGVDVVPVGARSSSAACG